MNNKIISSLIALFFGLISGQSLAQYSGYYVEGFYGTGDTQFEFFSDLSDFNANSDFYGITVGRAFNDNISAEVSYIDFGDSQSVIANPAIATLDSRFESSAIAITAVGTYPISRYLTAFGKLGFNQWQLDASVTDNTSLPALTLSGEDRGTGINYGVGVQYRITPSYALKVEYQIFELNPELLSGDVNIGGVTVALRFNY